ncbi:MULTISPECIES: helix-turn-helix domain-containing protein [Streptomyces]|uniref:helix-turn-helix domain-containing protein n=1 Tax=Streptomyces TaxID=1883 RepID=UPI000AAF8A84|nr:MULTISPECIES: helix-turn-helix domain-containing protein [Streptomyces]
MIPRNRPVINESDIAQQAGVPIATWRRRDAPALRQRVPALFPSSRVLVYDLAQAQAYIDGRPIPALPTGEHPDDRLNDEEAAAVLGVAASTVRAYATQGYLPAGTTVYSLRLWARRDIEDRRNTPTRQGKGGGRPPGKESKLRKAHAYEGDPRLRTATAALKTAEDTPRTRLAATLADQHGGSTRTWERLLAQADRDTGTDPDARQPHGGATTRACAVGGER